MCTGSCGDCKREDDAEKEALVVMLLSADAELYANTTI
jgi:hypothetical protein